MKELVADGAAFSDIFPKFPSWKRVQKHDPSSVIACAPPVAAPAPALDASDSCSGDAIVNSSVSVTEIDACHSHIGTLDKDEKLRESMLDAHEAQQRVNMLEQKCTNIGQVIAHNMRFGGTAPR